MNFIAFHPLFSNLSNILDIFNPVVMPAGFLALFNFDPLMIKYPNGQIYYAIGMVGIACGLWWTLLRSKKKLSRNKVIETIEDGWMIVDSNDRIVDVNPAGEKILGIVKKDVFGKPVSDIMAEWHIIINPDERIRGVEMRRSMKEEKGWRYFNIQVVKLLDHRHQIRLGYLFIWRDITKHRLVENARQKAREELFVLLNGISSAASRATSLDDFLLESIHQIISTFRSQAIGIFLVNQDARSKEEQLLTLRAHIGLPMLARQRMSNIPASIAIWQEIVRTNQYVLIDDPKNESLLPPPMREVDYSRLLVLPLLLRAENSANILGCLFLATNDSIVFTQDEIVRLTIISEHIGQLIEDDRRRQTSIALMERQRLLRDLHDSVSQKLYGLVAMTEASQATLEAGSRIDPSQVLAKIGESARQAVKEMRLFLHELQPIDLEIEGLVSALNRRLAAVEGRADVKTRLLVDEKVNLSKEEENALYFIAQEALNNTLKHARAKSVSLVLKKIRNTVILEILDDGIGFDNKKLDGVGMGLRNMQERVAQINGKLKITSKPGHGTKVTVTVSKTLFGSNKNHRAGRAIAGQPAGMTDIHQGEMFFGTYPQAKSPKKTNSKGRSSAKKVANR